MEIILLDLLMFIPNHRNGKSMLDVAVDQIE